MEPIQNNNINEEVKDIIQDDQGKKTLEINRHRPVNKKTVVIICLVVCSGVFSMFSFADDNTDVENKEVKQINTTFDEYEGAYAVLSAIPIDTIKEGDSMLIAEYAKQIIEGGNPPMDDVKRIVNDNKKIIDLLDDVVINDVLRCPILMNEPCDLRSARILTDLIVLEIYTSNGFVTTEDTYIKASKIVIIGLLIQNGKGTEDIISLISSWDILKKGYTLMNSFQNEQDSLGILNPTNIQDMRYAHKNILSIMHDRHIEMIDSITNKDKIPSFPLSYGDNELLDEFRKVANQFTWQPDIIKQWINDSYKISFDNINAECGADITDSQIDVGFDYEDTDDENYLGKYYYSTAFSSSESLNKKRCEVEALIMSL